MINCTNKEQVQENFIGLKCPICGNNLYLDIVDTSVAAVCPNDDFITDYYKAPFLEEIESAHAWKGLCSRCHKNKITQEYNFGKYCDECFEIVNHDIINWFMS